MAEPDSGAVAGSVTRDGAVRVLVGVDGSELSIAALRRAKSIVERQGGSVTVVTTWEYPTMSADTTPDLSRLDLAAEEAQHAALTAVFGEERPDYLTTHTELGGAARILTEHSRNADLLIVGSLGHGGFIGLLIGSVSRACVEHAKCDVLVVRS